MSGPWLLRELAFPLTDRVVLIAIVIFTLLFGLARQAGILGLWLGIILVPALYRYLLMVLDARANGRSTPVAGIEDFSIADNFWSLTPLVLQAVAIWGSVLLQHAVSPLAGWAFAAAIVALLPASLAVLALTRSPFESLDPRAMLRMLRACGAGYALIPATLVLAGFSLASLAAAGLPDILLAAVAIYAVFLTVTLTGSLLFENGVQFAIGIPDPLEPDEGTGMARRLQSRRRVLTHAYGFIARDNRAGGITHIRSALRDEGDGHEAWRWYIAEMLNWESKDAALVLAQQFLSCLLQDGQEIEAVKLMSRCLLVDGRFRPLADDREAARDAAQRLDREDLVRALDL